MEDQVAGFSYKSLQVAFDPSQPLKDFYEHLLAVCRPSWTQVKLWQEELDGITNKLIAFVEEGAEKDEESIVLVRLNGNNTEVFIDREKELVIMLWLHQQGLSPPVYCRLLNGLCYGFVPGRQVKLTELHDPVMGKRVAVALARLHTLNPISYFNEPVLFTDFKKFLARIPETFTSSRVNESFKRLFGSIETYRKEIEEIEQVMRTLKSPLVFCHNDLLSGNLIYNQKRDSITFIDFEYGGLNPSAYDIGDYFVEFAGLDTPDYDLFPSEEFQKNWIRDYLTEVARLKGEPQHTVTEDAIHLTYIETSKCVLASHLYWGVWALLQAEYSKINFDYIEYSGVRFKEYLSKKEQFLSL